MRQIILLALLVIATSISKAQSIDTSYHLLWFKGKEIKPNVLLTAKGDVVSYDPAKGSIKMESKSGAGKELDKILAEVNKTPQRINEMMQKLSGSLPKQVVPYYAKPLKEAYEELQQAYSGALSNTLQVPEFSGSAAIQSPGRGPSYFMDDGNDDPTERAIGEIQAYMKQHQNDNIDDIPAPPSKDFRYCSQCDKTAKEIYKKAYAEFDKKMLDEERSIMQKILSLERYWTLESEKKPGIPGSKEYAQSVIDRLYPVSQFLMAREGKKAKKLVEKYGNDPLRSQAVCVMALSIERERQLFGSSQPAVEKIVYADGLSIDVEKQGDGESLDLSFLTGILDNVSKMMEKAMAEYDYSIALNPGFILSIERQKELLGSAGSGHPDDMFSKFLKFDRFKLHINISGKISGKGFYQLAELKGDNYFAAAPDPNDTITCRLKWVLVGPDPSAKKMKFYLVDAKMLGKGEELVYAGTKKWKSNPPKLRIDFCNNGKDTAEVFSFQPDEGKETWNVPKYGPLDISAMSSVLLGCFMDIDRIRKETNMASAEKMKQQMMQEYQKFQQNYSAANSPSPSQVSSMMNMAKALSSGSKVGEIAQDNGVSSYLIKPTVQNKSQMVFKERLNGKELFPQNSKTEYAWLDVTLEQDPGDE